MCWTHCLQWIVRTTNACSLDQASLRTQAQGCPVCESFIGLGCRIVADLVVQVKEESKTWSIFGVPNMEKASKLLQVSFFNLSAWIPLKPSFKWLCTSAYLCLPPYSSHNVWELMRRSLPKIISHELWINFKHFCYLFSKGGNSERDLRFQLNSIFHK